MRHQQADPWKTNTRVNANLAVEPRASDRRED